MATANGTSNHAMLEQIQNSQTAIFGEISRLNQAIGQGISATTTHAEKAFSIRAFFTKTNDGRKPYVLITEGALVLHQKLSSIRAAILLVSLLDLQDRAEGGRGIIYPDRCLLHAFTKLSDKQQGNEQNEQRLRVALYRFNEFCINKSVFYTDHFHLRFCSESRSFELIENGKLGNPKTLDIELGTDNSVIADIIDQTITTSPLAQARKRKALYVPQPDLNHTTACFMNCLITTSRYM